MIAAKAGGPSPSTLLDPSPALLATADGVDIVRKGGKKTGRYLIMMPGLVDFKAGGEVGELHNIDGASPTLTVTLPRDAGRVRFQGRVVYPKQHFLHLNFEKKGAVCKDDFDTMVSGGGGGGGAGGRGW